MTWDFEGAACPAELAPLETAELVVQLGRVLQELSAVLANGRDDGDSRREWQRRLGRLVAGLAQVAGSVMVLSGQLELQRPANWTTGSAWVSLESVIEDGFPVLWVPGAEVLNALSKLDDRGARQQLLLDRRPEVLAHARAVLSEVTSPDLAMEREVVGQALDGVVGQPFPAQLAALTVAIQRAEAEVGVANFKDLYSVALDAAARGLEVTVDDLRMTLMLTAVAPTLEHFYPSRQDPVPTRPNRHAVTHVTSSVQYTPGNALESVLLAVSVLRQAQANRQPPTLSL